ncbi:hypothetical protein GCM10009765_06130 [Fodinicola feengrottensis]|uniref:Serine/threonine protein kinase n=1 Tax=Fodinicola feengrottensis TaxID=435914 RepID=A0ABP4RT20_9ACTN
MALIGVVLVGILVNVGIWYGLPQLLGTTQVAVADTKPAPQPTGTQSSAAGADTGRLDPSGVGSGTPDPSHPGSPVAGGPGSPAAGHGTPGGPQPPAGSGHQPPPSTRPSPPPPVVRTQQVTAQHGSATFRYSKGSLDVIGTEPADGYQVSVTRLSPTEMGVQFTAGKQKETILAAVDDSGTFKSGVIESNGQ